MSHLNSILSNLERRGVSPLLVTPRIAREVGLAVFGSMEFGAEVRRILRAHQAKLDRQTAGLDRAARRRGKAWRRVQKP